MHLLQKSHLSPTKEPAHPPRTSPDVLQDRPDKPLDFWYIKRHDRKTLVNHIMPYMAQRLPKKFLLQAVLEEHKWARKIFEPGLTEAGDADPACLRQIIPAFWKGPREISVKLLQLTRLLFFTLLRHTYRTRSLEESETYRSDFDVLEIGSCRNQPYILELTGEEVCRLTRLRNKYGASFYRHSYKLAKDCLGWTRFCTRIRILCRVVGLHASSNDPEQSLKELEDNLTLIMLQRVSSRISTQLNDKTAIVVYENERYMNEINQRVVSEGTNILKLIEETEQEIRNLQLQLRELQLAYTSLSHSQQCDTKLSTELEKRHLASTQESNLKCSIEKSRTRSKHLMTTLAEQIAEPRTESDRSYAPKQECPTAEALIACRWLLEHLPPATSKQEGFGHRWRQFWQSQWSQCRKEPKRDVHPLWGLVCDEKYNKVGKSLYGTLSNRLHGYGRLRSNALHPDVQKVVDTISPVHYNSNGKINLEAERKRWLDRS